MTARDVWRWTDERGVQRLVGTDELRAALASAILSPSTLVWREGMKEWAPANTVPELASAAFAGAAPPKGEAMALSEKERRSTLVGLPPPAETPGAKGGPPKPPIRSAEVTKSVTVSVPSAGGHGDRPPVTQVPPFGGPAPDPSVPRAPRVPAPAVAAPAPAATAAEAAADKLKPKRKITTSELDGLWASTTHSDEDDTIPRRARPSELAAAAAASAEATAQRDTRGHPERKKSIPPPLPPRRAAQPSPGGARLEARDAVPPKDEGAPAQAPVTTGSPVATGSLAGAPGRPKSMPPPPPPPRLVSGAAVPLKPAIPAVRIKPPTVDAIDDLATESKSTPFRMGAQSAAVMGGVTLTGVAAAVMPETSVTMGNAVTMGNPVGVPQTPPVQGAPAAEAAKPAAEASKPRAPAEAKPRKPPPPLPTHPKPDPVTLTAPFPTDINKASKTLVSPRDAIDSVPGLAEAIAAADDPSGKAPAEDEVTAPGNWPANGTAAAKAAPAAQAQPHARAAAPAPAAGNGHEAKEAAPEPFDTTLPLPPTKPREAPSHPPPAAAREVPSHPPPAAGQAPETPLPPPARVPLSSHPPPMRSEMPSFTSETGDVPRGRLDEQVAVPLSSLVGAGGLLIGLVIGAFFMGRASSIGKTRLTAHPSLAAVPVVARAVLPAPPKPCWVAKQPAMWAPRAVNRVPFDAVATARGTLALGYAYDARQAMGIEVDLDTGEVKSRLEDKAKEEIERVVPTPAVEFRVARTGTGGALRGPIDVPGHDGEPGRGSPNPSGHEAGPHGAAVPSFAVGQTDAGIAIASPPDAPPAPLWPLEGDEALSGAIVRPAGDGFALVYRRGGAIWGGFIGADRKAKGEIVQIAGSGGAVGKPAAAWNGKEVAVIFAERPAGEPHYQLRVGHAPPGSIPKVTALVPLPKGGPGEDAIAPDLAGLPDGRWLIMWTEGSSGGRAVRAQTLAADFNPLGDPIAISPPAGNFGQGLIGVVGDHAATVFLLSKGSSSFELWGAVLQCGG